MQHDSMAFFNPPHVSFTFYLVIPILLIDSDYYRFPVLIAIWFMYYFDVKNIYSVCFCKTFHCS